MPTGTSTLVNQEQLHLKCPMELHRLLQTDLFCMICNLFAIDTLNNITMLKVRKCNCIINHIQNIFRNRIRFAFL